MPTLVEPEAVISGDPSVLQEIRQPDCNLAIWKRLPPLDAAPLLAGEPKSIRIMVPADAPSPAIRDAMRENGFTDEKTCDALIEDIDRLCGLFAPFAKTARMQFRLDVVSDDACRKFHGDYVRGRLVTTYAGPGTQWLSPRGVDQLAQGLEPERINLLAPGDVGIFKGRLATGYPAIHRSPPIEGTGQKRLVLVLNPDEGD